MSQKLFFFDLDGTLLNEKKEITPATYAALKAWHTAGHRIAISSGRPIRSILEVIRTQGLEPFSPYAVAFNGALVYDSTEQKAVLRKTLSLTQVSDVSRIAAGLSLYIHSYDDTHIYTPRDGEELAFYTRVVKVPYILLPGFPKGLPAPPCKMICIDLTGSDKEARLAEQVRETYGEAICCIRSNPWYMEVFPGDAGKGTAVSELAEYLQIDPSDTFAAGDAPNDISMLKAAGCGIAMQNAEASVKEEADEITETDNDHDGLAPLILRNL
ncbi:MAG: HAD family phosphatase [Lachnospiraceae bacterium]|nr:HAD family phosphatase [Lachnospiraceae bacterium]